jgi:hypothetical protein
MLNDTGIHDTAPLLEMKKKIDEIERLVLDLQALGAGAPVLEKNTRCILGFVYALKFGISDIAGITDTQGG